MAAEKIGAVKAVGTDKVAYMSDKEKDKEKTTGFLAYNNGTVPMISGNYAASPGSQRAFC